MKQLSTIQSVYFIGIGGIGMSALARYFHHRGVKVSGYDRTPTVITDGLQSLGITIYFEDIVDHLPTAIDLVVYTPAIPASQPSLVYYREQGYEVVKRSDVLQIISEGSFNICVGGTHGKTTITTMVGHLLRDTGYGCNAFLGGISANYNTNFWASEKNVAVIEADEYDRSFLKLTPDIIIISAMDADHLDIYGTEEVMQDTYVQFTRQLKSGGVLIHKKGIAREHQLEAAKCISYGNKDGAQVRATAIRVIDGAYHFNVLGENWQLENVVLNMGGLHNVENMTAAITVAMELGIEPSLIKAAIASFKGVRRRFEFALKQNNAVVIDDYAHHPEELRVLIEGARSLYPNDPITIVFQPHLFSRTRDLVEGFAASLDKADEVILLPIYPARELPIPGVNSGIIRERMQNTNVIELDKEALLSWMKEHQPKVVLMAGAGDIDKLVNSVKQILTVE